MPTWGADLSGIDFDNIKYFVRSTEKQAQTWEDLPEDIRNTYEKLGIPEAERKRLVAGVAAQYESEVVYHRSTRSSRRKGVIFMDTDTALREHPEFFEEYFGTVIPAGDNKFAALNTAVWSGGSFVYVPKGVHVEIPLQAYFRINTENMGQFERTLIIADEGSYVHYIEGCTAPIYKSDSLHSAVVEIIVKKNARVRYTTIQNWSNNVYNLVTKRAIAHEGATMEWIDGNIGSKVTMKYPSIYLVGEHAKGETLSVAFAGPGQHQDAGAKMIHMAPYTHVVDRLEVDRARRRPRRLPRRGARRRRTRTTPRTRCAATRCWSTRSRRSDTYPAIDIRVDDVQLGHEATVSRVSEEQLFYLMSPRHARGRGHGDDRARLHRADRARAADGVRPRAQQAHRDGHGRERRLGGGRRRDTVHGPGEPAQGARLERGTGTGTRPAIIADATTGPAPCRCRRATSAFTSTDVRPIPAGHRAARRRGSSRPIAALATLIDGELDGSTLRARRDDRRRRLSTGSVATTRASAPPASRRTGHPRTPGRRSRRRCSSG